MTNFSICESRRLVAVARSCCVARVVRIVVVSAVALRIQRRVALRWHRPRRGLALLIHIILAMSFVPFSLLAFTMSRYYVLRGFECSEDFNTLQSLLSALFLSLGASSALGVSCIVRVALAITLIFR